MAGDGPTVIGNKMPYHIRRDPKKQPRMRRDLARCEHSPQVTCGQGDCNAPLVLSSSRGQIWRIPVGWRPAIAAGDVAGTTSISIWSDDQPSPIPYASTCIMRRVVCIDISQKNPCSREETSEASFQVAALPRRHACPGYNGSCRAHRFASLKPCSQPRYTTTSSDSDLHRSIQGRYAIGSTQVCMVTACSPQWNDESMLSDSGRK